MNSHLKIQIGIDQVHTAGSTVPGAALLQLDHGRVDVPFGSAGSGASLAA